MEPNIYDYEVQKEKLKRSTEDLKKALEIEIDQMKESMGEWGKVVMVAGGALLLTYMIVKTFRRSRSKKRVVTEQAYHPVRVKQSNVLARRILEQIAFFVLAIAKQKLLQRLEQKKNHEK